MYKLKETGGRCANVNLSWFGFVCVCLWKAIEESFHMPSKDNQQSEERDRERVCKKERALLLGFC